MRRRGGNWRLGIACIIRGVLGGVVYIGYIGIWNPVFVYNLGVYTRVSDQNVFSIHTIDN